MEQRGWSNYGRFAFACNYTPGQPDEAPFLRFAATITSTTQEAVPDDRMPVIRMLFFESYTLAAADLNNRIHRREDDVPRKLAAPERAARSEE